MKRLAPWLCTIGFCLFGTLSHAQGTDVDEEESTRGGYLQLGTGVAVAKNLFDDDYDGWIPVPIEGRYHWQDVFVEVSSENVVLAGFAMGYQLWSSEHYTIDLFATVSDFGFRAEDFDRLEDSNINDRHPGVLAGARATLFYQSNIFQLHLLPAGNRGAAAAFAAGRHWQHRNWNFAASVAARYNSSDINDYFYGVDPEEISDEFAFYEAGAGIDTFMELAIEKPLFRRWVFKTALRHTRLPGTVADSPILTSGSQNSIRVLFSYVF